MALLSPSELKTLIARTSQSSMEGIDYLSQQPREILVEIFYSLDVPSVSALCSTSPAFAVICRDEALRQQILTRILAAESEEELRIRWEKLVDDNQRREDHTVLPRELEVLEAIISLHPEWLNQSLRRKPKTSSEEVPPLLRTRNPLIGDLLLRYGANPNYHSRYGSLIYEVADSMRIMNTHYLYLHQLVAYGGKLLSETKNNIVSERDRTTIGMISAPDGFDFTVDMIAQGAFDPRYRGRNRESVAYIHRQGLSIYLRCLLYLRLGVDCTLEEENHPLFFEWAFESDNYPCFKLAWCFEPVSLETVKRLNLDRLLYQKTEELEELLFQTSKVREKQGTYLNFLRDTITAVNKVPRDLLEQDYAVLRLLDVSVKDGIWNNDPFWERKLQHDYPNEPYPPGSGRERYLHHHTTPRALIRVKGVTHSLMLPYHVGRGFVICSWLLFANRWDQEWQALSLRLVGDEYRLIGHQRHYVGGYEVLSKTRHLIGNDYRQLDLFDFFCFKPGDEYKELVMIEESNGEREIKVPTPFCPLVMKLSSTDRKHRYTLQFTSYSWYKGYLLLCKVLGLDPMEYGSELRRVV